MKTFILLLIPILGNCVDPLLMHYCYEENTSAIHERCLELAECGEECEIDAVLGEMYMSYKMQREVHLEYFMDKIDDILKRNSEK